MYLWLFNGIEMKLVPIQIVLSNLIGDYLLLDLKCPSKDNNKNRVFLNEPIPGANNQIALECFFGRPFHIIFEILEYGSNICPHYLFM